MGRSVCWPGNTRAEGVSTPSIRASGLTSVDGDILPFLVVLYESLYLLLITNSATMPLMENAERIRSVTIPATCLRQCVKAAFLFVGLLLFAARPVIAAPCNKPDECPAGQALNWSDSQSKFICVTMPPTNCVARYANESVKVDCGFKSSIQCASGEYAVSGGMWGGSNAQLQNSVPLFTSGSPNGWEITAYDLSGAGTCTGNSTAANSKSTVVLNTNPPNNPPQFQIGGGAYMSGAAMVVCCQ